MQILELEQKQNELLNFLNEPASDRTKLLRISEFFSSVLSSSNLNLTQVYVTSLFSEYLSLLDRIKIRGLSFDNFSFILNQFDNLKGLDYLSCYQEEIENVRTVLQRKYDLLTSWLSGGLTEIEKRLIYFPVLEKCEPEGGIGFLEIIRVKISDGENKFIIDPYESENDAQLQKQMHLCWGKAIEFCLKYIKKIKPTHTVELKFENRLGVYVGNSLGIALTLAFIEGILKHYNSKTIVNINGCIAVTGGIDKDSKIISTSKTIIEIKVESVFYSDAQIFCVPKTDEIWAEEKFKELKERYPKRNLRIIGLNDLDDLLDRRQIVDIKKQKLVVRTGKFVKKNCFSAVATVLLAILFAYLFVMDFDDNPVLLQTDGSNLFVKNKNGKVLWTKNINLGGDELSNSELLSTARIIDIDEDKVNEVLLTQKFDDKTLTLTDYSSVYCYDKKGKIIWTYEFKDSVVSSREELKPDYTVKMVDTLTIYSKKNILLISKNMTSYSSAIFRINLRTGKRLPGTVWTAGHIMEGEINDIDKDGKKEFIGTGYDNGYEDVAFWGVEIDSLLKMRPTTEDYCLRNMSIAEMKVYIRFPKIDYDYYKQIRTPTLISANFSDNQNQREYRFSVGENTQVQIPNISYKINYNLKDIDIIITSGFRVRRDSLVVQGKLNLPFTDTDAYKKIIMDNILYWKDGEWVKKDELD